MKNNKANYNISPGAWVRAVYETIKAEEQEKELNKSKMQRLKNQEQWDKNFGPIKIKENIYDITRCFHPSGTQFLGVYGMFGYNKTVTNNQMAFNAFTQKSSSSAGGILVFSSDVTEDKVKNAGYPLNHSFTGKFTFKDKIYNNQSFTIDLTGLDSEKLENITINLRQNFTEAAVLLKDCNTGKVYLYL